jgi:hypothetical protein
LRRPRKWFYIDDVSGTKYFTPVQASGTLPLVRRIVRDILERGRRVRELAPGGQVPDANRPEFDQAMRRLQELFRELESLGCSYKDWSFSVGLVDFPARIDGRDVLLCWRSDEPEIRYYHGLQDGYAGRKLIPRPLLVHGDPEPGSATRR